MMRFHALHDLRRYFTQYRNAGPLTPRRKCTVYGYNDAPL